MKKEYIFPLILIALDIGAGIVYAAAGDYKKLVYWLAAARYLTKCHSGKKMYKCSKNMKKPVIEEKKDGQMSERKLRELGEQRVDDREYWEKKYPSYDFVSCRPFYNEYNGHWYITVIMYKKDTTNSYYARQRKKAKPNFTYANIR